MIVRHLLVKLSFASDASKILKFDKHVDSLRSNILKLSAAFGVATVTLGYFIREAAKLEQTRIAFQVMTNSIEVGDRLLKRLYKFARTTPFQIPGVLQATRTLLAMGIESGNMVHTLTQIGEVSAGLNVRLDVLANIFGKVRSVGQLTGFEMERLRRAGVPLSEFLAKVMGTDIPGMLTMIRKKQIDFATFQEAWAAMVEDRFNGLMDKLLGTLLGIVSNLKDFIFEIVTYSGEALLPALKLLTSQLAVVLENSKDLVELNLKVFFTDLSKAILSLNKHFMRFISSSRESIYFFGGMKKALTGIGVILAVYFGGTTLKTLGWLFKSSITFLSVANLKLMLFAGSMLIILGVLGDIFETLTTNKDTLTRDFLNLLEKKFPSAFKTTMDWILLLKKEIEGMSLMLVGILTLDKDMISAGAYQVLEAYRAAEIEKRVSFLDSFFLAGALKGAVTGKSEEKKEEGKLNIIDTILPINVIRKSLKGIKGKAGTMIEKIRPYAKKAKRFVDETFTPGGKSPESINLYPSFMKEGDPMGTLIGALDGFKNSLLNPSITGLSGSIGLERNLKTIASINNNFTANITATRLPADADISAFTGSIEKSMVKAAERFSNEERRSSFNNLSTSEILGAKE